MVTRLESPVTLIGYYLQYIVWFEDYNTKTELVELVFGTHHCEIPVTYSEYDPILGKIESLFGEYYQHLSVFTPNDHTYIRALAIPHA